MSPGNPQLLNIGTMTEAELLKFLQPRETEEADVGRSEGRVSERAALEEILRRHYDWMFRLCLLELGDETLARDCAQEILIQAAKGLQRFRGQSTVKTWLFVIIKRYARRYRKRVQDYRARFPSLEPTELLREAPGPSAESRVLAAERSARLAALVQELPEKQRYAVWLHYFEDLSVEECALRMGCRASSVKTHLFRARNKLKTVIKEQAPEMMALDEELETE